MKDLDPYGTQQIFVPPALPQVLRVYAKAAIRTQPYDLLGWSASYFKALAEGRLPPVKLRIEYPLNKSKGGLTLGYLKILINQFSSTPEIIKESLFTAWEDVCLEVYELKQILCLAGVINNENFSLYKFVAVAAGLLSKSLTQTMITLCELYTEVPEGGNAAIPAELFTKLYTFLAPIDASKENKYLDGHLEGEDKRNNNADDSSDTDYNILPLAKPKNGFTKEDSDGNKSSDTYKISVDIPLHSDSEDGNNNVNSKFAVESGNELESRLTTSLSEETNGSSHQDNETSESNQNLKDDPDSKGERVTLRVFSEDGEKIKSSSLMSLPEAISPLNGKVGITIKEQQGIIEQILKTKDDKIKEMEAVMGSLEDLAEKSKKMTKQAEELSQLKHKSSKDSLFSFLTRDNGKTETKKLTASMSIDSQDVDPNAKGVVNPIFKGLFDNVATKMSAVNAFNKDIVVVPPMPGIGPPVHDALVKEFVKYVKETAVEQKNMFMPRDIRHCFCPPLEKMQ